MRCGLSFPLSDFHRRPNGMPTRICQPCHEAIQPEIDRQTAMIARFKEERAEAHEERDADRWLKRIEAREQRMAMAAQQAIFDAEDNDPKLASNRRMWQAIVNPSRFIRHVKTPQQIEREAQRKARAAANLLLDDPMRWKA
jgi:hypothetical protein